MKPKAKYKEVFAYEKKSIYYSSVLVCGVINGLGGIAAGIFRNIYTGRKFQ